MIKRIVFGLVSLSSLSAAPTFADSDGYYCVGADYIAYQFGLAAPPVAPHTLYVVRFDESGVQGTEAVQLPQFQVHGMRCGDAGVDIVSWDSVHTVSFDSAGRVTGQSAVPLLAPGQLPEWAKATPLRNVGALSRAAARGSTDRIVLKTFSERTVVLEITATPDPATPCLVSIVSRLITVDRRGQEEDAREVYKGRGLRC
jgi:hypothetical protein